MDIFVYFSHSLVTIPPPCWTNVAHRNGVQVLGTFITEWDEGAKVCRHLLQDDGTSIAAARQLAALALYYGFDGWLVNIENPIPRSMVARLRLFVRTLRDSCRTTLGAASSVLWYDSVTTTGELKWQNELNASNRPFFDDADGIFLNYHWGDAHLLRTSAALPQRHRSRVFAGIDVFGRGTYGGGGLNCDVAVRATRGAQLSTALFAPGWVFENQDKAQFEANQQAFWEAIAAAIAPLVRRVEGLPLFSDFNRGAGDAMFIEGRMLKRHPWSNISTQAILPTVPFNKLNPYSPGAGMAQSFSLATSWDYTDAFQGGSCLQLSGQISGKPGDRQVYRLIQTDFSMPPALCATFSLCRDSGSWLSVDLILVMEGGDIRYLALGSDPAAPAVEREEQAVDRNLRNKYGLTRSAAHTQGADTLHLAQCADVAPSWGCKQPGGQVESCSWKCLQFVIAEESLRGKRVTELRLSLRVKESLPAPCTVQLRLGRVSLFRPMELADLTREVDDLRCNDIRWAQVNRQLALSCTLSWSPFVTATAAVRLDDSHMVAGGRGRVTLSLVATVCREFVGLDSPRGRRSYLLQTAERYRVYLGDGTFLGVASTVSNLNYVHPPSLLCPATR